MKVFGGGSVIEHGPADALPHAHLNDEFCQESVDLLSLPVGVEQLTPAWIESALAERHPGVRVRSAVIDTIVCGTRRSIGRTSACDLRQGRF